MSTASTPHGSARLSAGQRPAAAHRGTRPLWPARCLLAVAATRAAARLLGAAGVLFGGECALGVICRDNATALRAVSRDPTSRT